MLFPRGFDELTVADQALTHEALARPFRVEGTRPEDVIVFSDGAMDENGVSGPQAYLCIEAHNQSMVLATEEFLLDNPGYQTMHFAEKLRRIDEGELEQFGLEALHRAVVTRRSF